MFETTSNPHPYCITRKHVAHASKRCCGLLTTECIREAEANGATCGVKGCMLSVDEHKFVLLVQVKNPPDDLNDIVDELQAYLVRIKPIVEEVFLKCAGFGFIK